MDVDDRNLSIRRRFKSFSMCDMRFLFTRLSRVTSNTLNKVDLFHYSDCRHCAFVLVWTDSFYFN